jgi:hypothetical protein
LRWLRKGIAHHTGQPLHVSHRNGSSAQAAGEQFAAATEQDDLTLQVVGGVPAEESMPPGKMGMAVI